MPGNRSGKPNKASAVREQRWAETGSTPLDVMQLAMRHFEDRAKKLMAIKTTGMSKKQRKLHEQDLDSAIRAAAGMAEKAAAYVHPRITATKILNDESEPIEVRVKYV